jgi:O-methyltransferase
MKSTKFINSFIRRFSDYIALNSDLYLSHKPDLHIKLNKIEDWDNLYSSWVKNSPRNDKGDLVRLYFLLNQIEYIKFNNIAGSIAEVGVYKGTTARLFHDFFPDKEILLFDTFEGFDQRDINHKKESSKPNLASKTVFNSSLESVQDFVGKSVSVKLIPGYFPETTIDIDPENQYALVHLDSDLYSPQFSGLEYFYPKMTPGGVIIIHDCNNEYTGSKRALNEFFLNKPEVPIIIPDKSGSAIVVKLKS